MPSLSPPNLLKVVEDDNGDVEAIQSVPLHENTSFLNFFIH
jgi:hypothetical protein